MAKIVVLGKPGSKHILPRPTHWDRILPKWGRPCNTILGNSYIPRMFICLFPSMFSNFFPFKDISILRVHHQKSRKFPHIHNTRYKLQWIRKKPINTHTYTYIYMKYDNNTNWIYKINNNHTQWVVIKIHLTGPKTIIEFWSQTLIIIPYNKYIYLFCLSYIVPKNIYH